MERTMDNPVSLEKKGDPEPAEKIHQEIDVRGITGKDDDPRGIPAGIPEKEHPGDDREGGGIDEMLGQHSYRVVAASLNGFFPGLHFSFVG